MNTLAMDVLVLREDGVYRLALAGKLDSDNGSKDV